MSPCWWSEYRHGCFALTTLSTPAPWDQKKGKPVVFSSGGFSFTMNEIKGHFDEVEEALWAFRNGLSNIVFEIKISPRRYRKKHL